MHENVIKAIRNIPNFPKPGIQFKDITTALKQADVYKEVIDFFIDELKDIEFDSIAAIESRGFFLAAPVAYMLNKGLILIRKPGKLPAETISAEYDLEYGKDKLEIHVDAIKEGQKVVIMDDLIATGGTLGAAIELVEKLNGKVVRTAFLMELEFFNAREKYGSKIPMITMLKF